MCCRFLRWNIRQVYQTWQRCRRRSRFVARGDLNPAPVGAAPESVAATLGCRGRCGRPTATLTPNTSEFDGRFPLLLSTQILTIITRAPLTETRPSAAADCSVTVFCWLSVLNYAPRVRGAWATLDGVFHIYYRSKCSEITLLRAFPASGPQSTFSLSTRCRRSDEVI
jgi:hypothetical protein